MNRESPSHALRRLKRRMVTRQLGRRWKLKSTQRANVWNSIDPTNDTFGEWGLQYTFAHPNGTYVNLIDEAPNSKDITLDRFDRPKSAPRGDGKRLLRRAMAYVRKKLPSKRTVSLCAVISRKRGTTNEEAAASQAKLNAYYESMGFKRYKDPHCDDPFVRDINGF